ncbi:MAG: hypothetical protein DRJ14_06835 [Acidobacteria bacterium]|nr:MAG: hypothetical protein DRJ14_06835 [Acidobacteriota bacterium]
MVKSWKELEGNAKPGIMGAMGNENAAMDDTMELFSIRNQYTKQILYQRLSNKEREQFQERAAIHQFEGGQTRENAEWVALREIALKKLFESGK